MTFADVLPGITVGDRVGPVALTVTRDLNEQYLFAMSDYDGLYVGGADDGRRVVHPGVLLNASMSSLVHFSPGPGWTGLHSRDEVEWHEPAYVDEPLEVVFEVVSLFEKRGRPWWIRRATISGAGSVKVIRTIHTAFVSNVS